MREVNVHKVSRKLSRLLDLVKRNGAASERERVLEEAAALRKRIEAQHGVRENPVLTEREEA